MNPKLLTLVRSKTISKSAPMKIVGLIALTALVAGCGTKSDPAADYGDLGNSVPVYDGKPRNQEVLSAGLFQADMPAVFKFIEGEAKSYPITISTMFTLLNFDLVPDGLPTGVKLSRIDRTHFMIGGTIPIGTSPGAQSGTEFPITISTINISGDQTEVRQFNNTHINHSWTPTLEVRATKSGPVVESQNLAGLTVNEGASIAISIIVEDIGSSGSQVPTGGFAFLRNSQSGEIAFVSAGAAVEMSDVPEAMGNGRFKFLGTLNTKNLQLPAGKKSVTARFSVNFMSPSGLKSADEIIDVKIVRAAPAPVAPKPAPAVAAKPTTPVTQAPAPQTPAPVPAPKAEAK